ncbi:transposase [Microbispora bryophytorum]|uniref:transposase n=1 Tax=Microbispora bryophytorum TaxID=1460882 RepID=UPI001431581E|nr:transposase [Microbispora bryophytorum]
MGETRRRFDPEFRAGAVRIVREAGKSVAQVARDLGINAGTLANGCRWTGWPVNRTPVPVVSRPSLSVRNWRVCAGRGPNGPRSAPSWT